MATDAIAWLAKETTTTTGTGTYTTSGVPADADHTTFTLALDDGDRIIYLVHASGTLFEIVEGVWTEATKQLTRALLIFSTTGALINWGAGTRDIYAIQPTHDTSLFALTANDLSDLADAPTARTNLGLDTAALEALAKFVVTDGSSTISKAAGALDFVLENLDASALQLIMGGITSSKEYRLRRTGGTDELRLFHWDGVSVETELIKFTSALITAAKAIRLPGDGTDDLDAATKQQVDAKGNLLLAAADELLWIGGTVPDGFVLKTGSSYDDRMPIIETTLAQLGNIAGDWDWKDSLGGDVDNHTIVISEMPSHTHDVKIKHADGGTGGPTGRVSGAGGSSTTFTPTDGALPTGGGGSHKHNLTSVTSWRPKSRKWGAIAKS